MVDTTVITPSVPVRHVQLHKAVHSVQDQTDPPCAHLISIGRRPEGMAPLAHMVDTFNTLAMAADTEWVTALADDDFFDPHHFATIAPALGTPVDVVYAFAHDHIPHVDVNGWSQDELVDRLEEGNFICGSGTTIRLEALWAAGGWSVEGWDPETHLYWGGPCWADDWDLWKRMARIGARFLCVPVETWHVGVGAPERLTDQANAIMGKGRGRVMLHG
jgi:hypothetical protein